MFEQVVALLGVIYAFFMHSTLGGLVLKVGLALAATWLMLLLAMFVHSQVSPPFARSALAHGWQWLFLASPFVAAFAGGWWWLLPLVASVVHGVFTRANGTHDEA